uniref:Ketoreductase domain-containing protein n=1 Tax=Oryza meridionalis TaxID=40149 RepID=A0A0E0EFP4_9ORYZ
MCVENERGEGQEQSRVDDVDWIRQPLLFRVKTRKVAVITGGASGIGEATAKEFIRNGAKVIIADVQDDLGHAVAAELGPDAAYTRCDVTDEAQIAATVDLAVARHGHLDILYNNAGITSSSVGPLASLDLADFDRVMAVNARAVLAGIKHAARVMAPRRAGSILCTASVAGLIGSEVPHAYSVSKAAAIGVVRSAAGELARHGVRLNAISPHGIATPLAMRGFGDVLAWADAERLKRVIEEDMNELEGAKLEAEDIARAAVYLASDEAKYITGHNLVVDGGFTVGKRLNGQEQSRVDDVDWIRQQFLLCVKTRKVAVITGGASGIGEATAKEFIRNGAKVIIADVQDDLGHTVAAELGPGSAYTRCDVTDEAQIAATVDLAVARHGHLDILYNNAGITSSSVGPLASLDLADFDRQQGGEMPHAYNVSKAAVISVVRSAAGELARHGVRLNAISPHGIATPLAMRGFGDVLAWADAERVRRLIEEDINELEGATLEAEDIAKAAVYLASDEAKYVTGHNLVVDGGGRSRGVRPMFSSGLADRLFSSSASSSKRLEGKVAVITGAVGGIGKATAKEFVRNGAKVIIADIQDDLGRAMAAELGADAASYTHCDVTVEADVAAAVDLAVARHGRLDVVYSNAGIPGAAAPPTLAALDLDDYDRVMAVNARSMVACLKHAARVMSPRRAGCILCTASSTAVIGDLAAPAYCVSKAAVVGMVRAVARRLARDGVRVNAISPHIIPTALATRVISETFPAASAEEVRRMVTREMQELEGASLEVEDVARAAVFLASDEAKFVTGHNLVVDGGFTVGKDLLRNPPSFA